MLYAVKVGFVIAVLTAVSAWILQAAIGQKSIKIASVTTYSTVLSLSALCISQIFIPFTSILAITAYFARKRVIAAGIAIFIIITMPSIHSIIMAGGIQLINFSIITSAILGLLIASLSWKGEFNSQKYTNDYSVYGVVIVLVFISSRNTSVTNILRVALEHIVSYIIPYLIVRKSLRDAYSVRVMVAFVIAAGLAVSAVAIFESFMVWPIYQTYGQMFGTLTNGGVKMRGGMLRAAGPSINPPLSAAVLALCFVTTFASDSLFKRKSGFRIVLCIIGLGLFCMQSRVGWLGAIAGIIGVLISKKGAKAFFTYVPAVLLTILTVYGVAQVNSSFANLVGFSADAKGSSDYRDRADKRSIEIIKQNLLIGQSAPVVMSQMEDLRQGEGIIDFTNGYMGIALFSGLIGFAIFMISLLYQAYNSFAGKRLARSRGAGSLANIGFGVSICILAMLPYIPIDYRVMIVTILLFALANAVITHSHVNLAVKRPLLGAKAKASA